MWSLFIRSSINPEHAPLIGRNLIQGFTQHLRLLRRLLPTWTADPTISNTLKLATHALISPVNSLSAIIYLMNIKRRWLRFWACRWLCRGHDRGKVSSIAAVMTVAMLLSVALALSWSRGSHGSCNKEVNWCGNDYCMHSQRIATYNRKSFGEGSHSHCSGNKVCELVAF